jgi:drug/metabolite transporter (DMT)-like permease
MNERKKISTRLAAGLLLAILFDTALQLIWKSAVLALPHEGSPSLSVNAILRNPLFICVIVLMGCQLLNWLMVLSKADLSYAQPVTSLSYVSVLFLSVLYLKEAADLFRITGIILLLLGVWFHQSDGARHTNPRNVRFDEPDEHRCASCRRLHAA